jgi:hypothetical protein
MNKTTTNLTHRVQRALQSGKLKRDTIYPVPALAVILGTTRLTLTNAVNREFGSIAKFYAQTCLAAAK